MLLAVISDVHANIEALNAVLADIDNQKADAVICLGDTVGYGPNPEEALQTLRDRGVAQIAGNHESALLRPDELRRFNPAARSALLLTAKLLSADARAFLETLPVTLVAYGILFVHGCPPDSAHTYLFEPSSNDLAARFATFDQNLCFVGHTHELELVTLASEREAPGRSAAERLTRAPLVAGAQILDARHRAIVNAGSVGQPRDGDALAKYALWRPETRVLEVRCVAYDFEATAAKILGRGIPEIYARRLRGRIQSL